MKNSKLNSKNNRKRTVNTKKILAVFFVVIVAFLAIYITKKNNKNESFKITPEIARSKEYDVVQAGDEKTNSDYVLFDAFFLKDLDGDENADAIRGTCNEVGKEDTLYMDLKIINNGHFKDGVITISSSNFNLATTLVKDQIIAQNYISENTKTIKLKDIQNGNQKLITGIVKANIGNDTTKYSKINSVALTGTHVADDGTETKINKTINIIVDWYGTVSSAIKVKNITNTVNKMDELIEGEDIKLKFEVETEEKDDKLIIKSSNIEGKIPELKGFKPKSFEITGENIEYTFDKETGMFSAKKEAVLDEDGVLGRHATSYERTNIYEFVLKYPKEAYDETEENNLELTIPLKAFYEGYNNPNEQFQNPYISNTAETTIVARWVKYEGHAFRFDIEVGEYATAPYKKQLISKEKPLKVYNGISEAEQSDYYTVRWDLRRGTEGEDSPVIMKETENGKSQVSDAFIKADASIESMEELTSNIGIYFTGSMNMFGEDGWIKVYNDETNELIETFTKDNWDKYNELNPYKYQESVKHIRVETSNANKNCSFRVYNIKEIDDKYITENYTIDEFEKFQYIKSHLSGYFGTDNATMTNTANYEAPTSIALIDVKERELSTQETMEQQIITISTDTYGYNKQKWKNGVFLVTMPKEIIDMDINSVTVDNNKISILGYDLYEEDGNYYIKILTENAEEDSYKIEINCSITPDPRSSTISRSIGLYAINENASCYYYKSKDLYDIDEDSNTSEIINYHTTDISLISPNELVTNQTVSNYDNKGNITVSPKVAKVEKTQRTADIEISIANNYVQEVNDILVQGVIPFKGNRYIVGDSDLNSEFSTWMSDGGLNVPNEIKDKVTIYYSTEEKPTKDLSDTANKWQKASEVSNWKDIKSYIIDFGDYKLKKGENYKFTYKVNIPEGIDYNNISYCEHAIYFSLLTDEGRYSTYTAANKLGIMIAKQYDLEIEKIQQDTNKKINGVTFSITEEGKDERKIKTTTVDGKLTIKGLLAEKTYTIKEIKTIDDYVINNEEIKIYTYLDESGQLKVAYKNEDGSYVKLEDKYQWLLDSKVEKNADSEYKVKISLENEVKTRLKITKIESKTEKKQKNVSFSIEGKEINKLLYTNSDGEINISGLYLNEEYKITEKRNNGYYLLAPIRFKIVNDNGTYSVQILEGNVKEQNIETVDNIPQLNLILENEKIPTYNLQILKIEEGKSDKEQKVLKNAKFMLIDEDNKTKKELITNENGIASIEDLYLHEEGKNITGKYTLKETVSPNGYANNTEEISFVTSKNNEEKLEVNIQNKDNLSSIKDVQIEGETVKLIIQDKPLFKLLKTDKESGKPLSNVKFTIIELADDGSEIDFAKDINGKYVGTLNKKNQYEVETDENGTIMLPLRNGTYKLHETQELEGYEKNEKDEIFKISSEEENNEDDVSYDEKNTNETLEINFIEDLLDLSNAVLNGNTFENTKVILKRTLDFNNENSYKNANDITTYGDYNNDGTQESIKDELKKGKGFISIGNSTKVFSGVFDGQNNAIDNIYCRGNDYLGLFGNTDSAMIKNVNISGQFFGTNYLAGIVGNALNTKIINCTNNAKISSSGLGAGGIVGKINGESSLISQCVNEAEINRQDGGTNIGGIVGETDSKLEILNCKNNGVITGEDRVGGILGTYSNSDSTYEESVIIKNCTNNATIYGRSDETGGIIATGNHLKIVNCDNKADIYASYYGAGIVSKSQTSVIDNCNNFGDLYIYSGYGSNFGGLIANGSGEILNSCNYGNIQVYSGSTAGIASNFEGKIYNCHNYGNITDTRGNSFIAGIANGSEISYCSNSGNIEAPNSTCVAGIAANSKTIKNCYNTGNITGRRLVGGIESSGCTSIEDVYNTGTIKFSDEVLVGGISSTTTSKPIKNAINTGKIIYVGTGNFYKTKMQLTGDNYSNIYYLTSTEEYIPNFDPNIIEIKTQEELNSYELFNALNTNNAWIYKEGRIPELKMPTTTAKKVTEIKIENAPKSYNIYTEVLENNGVKGGSISGENEKPYENVKHGKNSQKIIKIIPDENYIIEKITINGDYLAVIPESDGSYTLPQFEHMVEDKKIVVQFAPSDKVFTINKVDSKTNNGLANAEFEIIPVSDYTSKLNKNADYYFELDNETGKYKNTNSKPASGVENTIASSYVYLPITEPGDYYALIDVSYSTGTNGDYGYATITHGAPSASEEDNVDEVIKFSGEAQNKIYKTGLIKYRGANSYFVNINYKNTVSTDNGDDTLIVNKILLCNTSKTQKVKTNANGKASINIPYGNYVIIETKSPEGYKNNSEYNIINYSEESDNTITIGNLEKNKIIENHYLWTETEGITENKVAESKEYKGNLGDEYFTHPNTDIEYEIVRNKDFYKGKTQSEILSLLKVSTIQDADYSSWDEFYDDYYIPTNANGKYTETTQVVDYYYKEKTYTLTVKHLLEGTEQNVPSKTDGVVEDKVTEGLKKDENYTTEKSDDIDYTKYVLVDKSDNYKGKIEKDTEVRYYYKLKDTTGVIVYHYIVGTENKVPANTEGVVENEILPAFGTAKVGDEYETSNASDKIAQNYKVATNKDVYGNSIPTELEGKDNELYNPTNATGTYKDEIQEVTYYYILKTSDQTNSISKTGPETISAEDEKVKYKITYNATIQEYIGNATIQIVDILPYKIDVAKSSLNGGEYNEEEKTITWKELIKKIDTYSNSESGKISISKNISVVYKNIDHSKNTMTNKVTGSTKLLSSNVTTDVVEDTAITNYNFNNEEPSEPSESDNKEEQIDLVVNNNWEDNNNESKKRPSSVKMELTGNGKTYTQTLSNSNKSSSNSNIWSYTFKNLPKYDSEGNEITYKLSEKEVNKGDLNKYITTIDGYNVSNTLIVKDTKIEKEGTEKIISLDDTIKYSLKYTIGLNEGYKDEAKVTIIDTLPYEIDTSKEYNLDGGVYDSKKKTITWTSPYNNEMAITKNISLVYKDIDVTKTKITNNVKGIFELENGYKEEKTASFDTITDFTTSVEVNKVWIGDSKVNSDGTLTISSSRPNKATIELNTLDGNNKLNKIDKKDLTSNNNWQITFKNLPKYDTKTGKEIIYKVTENNVPKGYYNSIKQENNVFTITNSKYGSITITKVDSGDSSKKLGGAEFKLEKLKEVNGKMEVDNSYVSKIATTSSKEATLGKLEFKNLEYGTYRLTETKAPEGYSLSKNSTQIEITPEKIDYVGELSNKEKTTLPLTGGTGRNILIAVGTFFLIILFMIKKKRIYVVKK